jgi:hypothetical protein
MRRALVVGFAWVLGCGSATDTLPGYESSVGASSVSPSDGATALTGVASPSGLDAMALGGGEASAEALPADGAQEAVGAAITPSEDATLDAPAFADVSHGADSSDTGPPQDSGAGSSAKPPPEASTPEPEASTGQLDASTPEPDASTGPPDASTPKPDASTGPPDASTGKTCAPPGAGCNSPGDCCARETCVSLNGGSCAAICTMNSDCTSGCCAPLTNASGHVCAAPQFCP